MINHKTEVKKFLFPDLTAKDYNSELENIHKNVGDDLITGLNDIAAEDRQTNQQDIFQIDTEEIKEQAYNNGYKEAEKIFLAQHTRDNDFSALFGNITNKISEIKHHNEKICDELSQNIIQILHSVISKLSYEDNELYFNEKIKVFINKNLKKISELNDVKIFVHSKNLAEIKKYIRKKNLKIHDQIIFAADDALNFSECKISYKSGYIEMDTSKLITNIKQILIKAINAKFTEINDK